MKLKKINKNKKQIGIIIFTIICIFLIVGVFFYQTFALFETKNNLNIIDGQVQEIGDVIFAFYIDDVASKKMPDKDSDYVFDSSKSGCNNRASIVWNEELWGPTITNMTDSRTKCTIYFKYEVKDKILWETGKSNDANFNYYIYDIHNGEYQKKIITDFNTNIFLNNGVRGRDPTNSPPDLYQLICTDENLNTENYQFLNYSISSGTCQTTDLELAKTQYSFQVYDKGTKSLISNEHFSFTYEEGEFNYQVPMKMKNYEVNHKIDINKAIMSNGLCFEGSEWVQLFVPNTGEVSYKFEISKIWLSNS